jgi:hypothetical protein
MATYKVRLERELDDDFLMDVMITMVECNSINYWAHITNVTRRDDSMITEFEIRDQEDSEERVTITPEKVATAIDDVLNKQYHIGDYIMEYIRDAVATLDAGCIDAEAADVLAQVALHDEVIYG